MSGLTETIDRSYLCTEDLARIETILLGRMPGPIIQAADFLEDAPAQFLLMMFEGLVRMLRARYRFAEEIRLCLVGARCPVANACGFRIAEARYYIALPYEMVSHLYYQAELVSTCAPFQAAFGLDPAVVQLTAENAREFPRQEGLPLIVHTPVALRAGRAFGEGMVVVTLLHELGHIMNGHLGMISDAGQVLEEQVSELDVDVRLTRQTLEFDADCFAAVQTLDMFAHGYGVPPLLQPLCVSRDMAVKVGVAVVNLMFRAFDSGQVWSPDAIGKASTHPPARMRSALAREALGAAICRALKVSPERAALDYMVQPTLAIEHAHLLISQDSSWVGTLEAQSEDLSAYLRRLLRRWARIRPVLTKHKVGNHNLAPASMPPD